MRKRRIRLLSFVTCMAISLSACGSKTNDATGEVAQVTEVAEEKTEETGGDTSDAEVSSEVVNPEKVTSVDQIPKDYLDNLIFISGKVLDNQVHRDDCVCTNPDMEEDMFSVDDWDAHRNFDSYKLVGMAVTPSHMESDTNALALIYQLHFSIHEDVNTYVAVYYLNMYNKKCIVSDVTAHTLGGNTEAGGLKYIGFNSMDEMTSGMQKWLRFEDAVEIVPVQ